MSINLSHNSHDGANPNVSFVPKKEYLIICIQHKKIIENQAKYKIIRTYYILVLVLKFRMSNKIPQ